MDIEEVSIETFAKMRRPEEYEFEKDWARMETVLQSSDIDDINDLKHVFRDNYDLLSRVFTYYSCEGDDKLIAKPALETLVVQQELLPGKELAFQPNRLVTLCLRRRDLGQGIVQPVIAPKNFSPDDKTGGAKNTGGDGSFSFLFQCLHSFGFACARKD